jgi:DtxR family transcriptional regulator, Mn-dependent transcriptional regulator
VTSTRVSPALLECLDAIHRLTQEGLATSPPHVAKRLGLGVEAMTERVLALQGLGLVQGGETSKSVALTSQGERLGVALVRKHRLLERFLADALKLPWERVHEEAVRLTPVLGDDVAEALAALLGNPSTCPHGNPIPSARGVTPTERGIALTRLRTGQAGLILRIEREEPQVLRHLATLGLLPETKVEVEEIAPFGGPLLIRVGSSRYALGRNVATRILVRPL